MTTTTNFGIFGTITKSALALALVGAVTVGLGATGASASNGSTKSSDRSHEAHDENEKDHDGIGHGDDEDHVGRGRGHDSHGNGHGYGHGDGCDDHDETGDDVVAPTTTAPAPTAPAPTAPDSSIPPSTPASSGSEELPIDQPRSQQPDTAVSLETTVPAVQPASLVDGVNAPAGNAAGELSATPVITPATERAPELDTSEPGSGQPNSSQPGSVVPATTDSGTNASTGRLPMTGSSLVLIGLATAVAAVGLVVLVARRRRERVAA